jgi:hypothetical protein
MVLLISYDLNNHERPSAYAKIKAYIEGHAASSIRPLYSQWFVETNAGPNAWVKALRDNGLVDDNDRVFICQVPRPYQGLLTETDWTWLRARVS